MDVEAALVQLPATRLLGRPERLRELAGPVLDDLLGQVRHEERGAPADQLPGILGELERDRPEAGQALLADPAERLHPLEDVVAPNPHLLRVVDRVEVFGRPDHAGERGSFEQRELACGLPEVELGRRPESVDAVPHVDLVQVQLEDPLLRVALFHADRQGELLQLAFDAVVELLLPKGAADQLLRDRRTALDHLARAGVLDDRPDQATTRRSRRAGRSPSPRWRAPRAGWDARSCRAGRSPGCAGRPG